MNIVNWPLVVQFIQQCLGIFQVGSLEALGDSVADLREHCARFVVLGEQSRGARRRLSVNLIESGGPTGGSVKLVSIPSAERLSGVINFSVPLQPGHSYQAVVTVGRAPASYALTFQSVSTPGGTHLNSQGC